MQEVLIFSQLLFNFVAAFAIFVLGLILCIFVYYVIQIGKRLRAISENIEKSSAEVRENIAEFLDRLSEIPFLSLFLKRNRTHRENRNKNGK